MAIILNRIENCTVYYANWRGEFEEVLPNNNIWETDNLIKIVADEGYHFPDELEGKIGDTIVSPLSLVEGVFFNAERTEFQRVVPSSEWDIQPGPLGSTYTLYVEDFIAVEGTYSGGGEDVSDDVIGKFATIYNITSNELMELSQERQELVGEQVGHIREIDEYIANLYTIPFNIEEVSSDDKYNLFIGGYELQTKSKIVETSTLTVDLGEIEIFPQYNNAYDYVNTTILIHVPYSQPIELDVSIVMNKTIRVELLIDLYTAKATYNIIMVDEEEYTLVSSQAEVGRVIPFYQVGLRDNKVHSSEIGGVLLNNVWIPYAEIRRNIPYNEVEGVGQTFSQVEVIGNLEGYAEIEKVRLETSATMREQEQIISKLSNGVVIK